MFADTEKKLDYAFNVFWGVICIMMGLNLVHIYFEYSAYKDKHAGLIEACSVMGGTFIDDKTCIKAENLFK